MQALRKPIFSQTSDTFKLSKINASHLSPSCDKKLILCHLMLVKNTPPNSAMTKPGRAPAYFNSIDRKSQIFLGYTAYIIGLQTTGL